MHRIIITILVSFFSLSTLALPERYIVVANRGDSSISILDSSQGTIMNTVTSSEVGTDFEPMYIAHLHQIDVVAVGDRKNSQILFFDEKNFSLLGVAPTSRGVFHMWPSPNSSELYVVADIDRVIDIISVKRYDDKIAFRRKFINVKNSISSGKPHDIVVDRNSVFVSIKGLEEPGGKFDYLIRYNRKTRAPQSFTRFSFDIHLGLPNNSPYVLVAEQKAGRLNFLERKSSINKKIIKNLDGAHGVGWNSDSSRIFLTNITAIDTPAVYELGPRRGTHEFQPEIIAHHKLDNTKAHNIAVDFTNQKMFVTHSGPGKNGDLNTKVSLFSVAGESQFLKTIETGKNPFGILLIDTGKSK